MPFCSDLCMLHGTLNSSGIGKVEISQIKGCHPWDEIDLKFGPLYIHVIESILLFKFRFLLF